MSSDPKPKPSEDPLDNPTARATAADYWEERGCSHLRWWVEQHETGGVTTDLVHFALDYPHIDRVAPKREPSAEDVSLVAWLQKRCRRDNASLAFMTHHAHRRSDGEISCTKCGEIWRTGADLERTL